jgi:3',5'-cyclic AMP phosphodiesterase CpdA
MIPVVIGTQRALRQSWPALVCAILLVGCTASPGRRPFGEVQAAATALEVFAAGDIADCQHRSAEEAAAHFTAALIPAGAPVLALGDIAYPYATKSTLQGCYEPTWGAHRASTLLVAGNHDYVGGSTQVVRDYFALDPAVDSRFVAYTKWLTPAWFVVVLDSNVTGEALDAQYEWLQQTLQHEFATPAATTPAAGSRCVMALWHAPLFSSGLHHGSGLRMQRFWALLDVYGADLVLSGHEHMYEAFEPMNSTGARQPDGEGMRQFVVGTGGAPLYGFWRPPYSSRARVLLHGVLALELSPGAYAWSFRGTDGLAHDWGSARCRRGSVSPAPTAARSTPPEPARLAPAS